MPGLRLQRSGWLPCAMQAAMAADCGLITGLSYGCQRCSPCEQPGSRSSRPPPRRAPAERAGASRGLTGAPQDLKMVRGGLSNPPYSPVLSPIRPVLCPSDSLHSRFFALAGRFARAQAGPIAGDARPDARARRRAHGEATAARRGAVGASRARFALAWPGPIPQTAVGSVCCACLRGAPMAVATGPDRSNPVRWYPLAMLTPRRAPGSRFESARGRVRVATHIPSSKLIY